jgi:TfoX/Sxy family transcriptional regulator of competence genes
MAYDEKLAERIRSALGDHPGVTEKKMFGGIAFLLDGSMFVGIVKNDLMVRVGPEAYEAALSELHVRPMDFTGRPMVGYVFVGPEGNKTVRSVAKWVKRGAEFVTTLPAKKAKPKRRPPARFKK